MENEEKTKKSGLTTLDREKATKSKLEKRVWLNYQCPKNRIELGHDDKWFQNKMSKIPDNYRVRAHDAAHGKLSPIKAIAAMCAQCVGYDEVKESIRDCRGASCPLYSYRPHQK